MLVALTSYPTMQTSNKRFARVINRAHFFCARALLAAALLTSASCDDDSSTGPTFNSVTLIPSGNVVPLNGGVDITARVADLSGVPVGDGTVVTFTCCAAISAGVGLDAGVAAQTSESGSLGTIDPPTATTVNGSVTVHFTAGTRSGVARIGASVAGGREEELELLVGAAAATRLTINTSASVVPSAGGSVDVTATVLDAAGNGVAGVPVTFATGSGTLTQSSATSAASGKATTRLTTTREAVVTATVGTLLQPASVTVRVSPAPTVTTTVNPQSPTVGQAAQFSFAIGVQTGGAALRDLVVDFGDGNKRTLTGVSPGTSTIAQTYATAGVYTVTATATDVSGESSTATSVIAVQPRPPVLITVDVLGGTNAIVKNVPVVFSVTVNPATEQARVVRYEWDFGDLAPPISVNSSTISRVYPTSGLRTYKVSVFMTDGQKFTAEGAIFVKE
jgi:adhesin/invasin